MEDSLKNYSCGSPSIPKTDTILIPSIVQALSDTESGNDVNDTFLNHSISTESESQDEDDENDHVEDAAQKDDIYEEDITTEDSDPEEWNSSDESESGALLDVYESRFLALLDQRISDTEKLFDNQDCILRITSQQKDSIPQISSYSIQPTLTTLALTADKDTQTEVEYTIRNQFEISSVHNSSEVSHRTSDAEKAREEIVHLRNTRDSLLTQRQELAKEIKESPDVDTNDERKLFEFEEAIAAIDSCIEFKNEIICDREYILSNDFAPGNSETNLVTRLTSLTVLDLQRLLCTLFSKVVEFRHSTKKMEKQVVELQTKYEQANRRCIRYEKQSKQAEDEYKTRIKEIIRLYSNNTEADLGHFLRDSKTSKTARKKINDLELSLTELLVRHGYLGNETDYEVKHLVKMLGIDPLKLKLHQMEDDDEEKKAVIPASLRFQLANGIPVSQGISRRWREAYGHSRYHHSSGGGHDSHGQGQAASSSTHHHRHNQTNGHTSAHPTSSKHKRKP